MLASKQTEMIFLGQVVPVLKLEVQCPKNLPNPNKPGELLSLQVTLLARDKVYMSKPLVPLRESIQLRSFQWDVSGSDPFSHCA